MVALSKPVHVLFLEIYFISFQLKIIRVVLQLQHNN